MYSDQNVSNYIARNIQFREPIISNVDLGTINVSLMWFPPIDSFNLQRFTFIVEKSSRGPEPQFYDQVRKA